MNTPTIQQHVFPQLRVRDWKRARHFYVEGLGFQVDWTHQFEEGFPIFAQVSREGRALFLTEHAGDCEPGGAAYIVLDDLDASFTTRYFGAESCSPNRLKRRRGDAARCIS
jgi:catechol 2,3-dioxygenase-like lactoylglutathione lyase family enzyme